MKKTITSFGLFSITVSLSHAATFGATDVDTWSQSAGATSVILNGTTSSPTFGDVTPGSNNIDNVSFGGTWGASATIEIGETFSATGSFTLFDETLTNSAGSFRLALAQESTTTPGNGAGGFMFRTNIDGSPANEFFDTVRTDGSFASSAGNSITIPNTDVSSGAWSIGTEYTFDFSIFRASASQADLTMTVTGSGLSLVQTGSDTSASAADFVLDTVVFSLPSQPDLDAAILSNFQVAVVPEPSTAALLTGFAGLAMVFIRRRR